MGEFAAGPATPQLTDMQGQAMQGIVGLHVVTFAGRHKHVDNRNDIVASALVDLRDGSLNFIFIDVRTVHPPLVGVGHLINKSGKSR